METPSDEEWGDWTREQRTEYTEWLEAKVIDRREAVTVEELQWFTSLALRRTHLSKSEQGEVVLRYEWYCEQEGREPDPEWSKLVSRAQRRKAEELRAKEPEQYEANMQEYYSSDETQAKRFRVHRPGQGRHF